MSIEEPHKFVCPSCDYTLESRMEICPECGYHVVPEDRSLAERRGVFLELTSVQAVAWPVGLCAAAVFLGYGVPLIVLGPAIISGRFVGADRPRLHRRLLRRVWMLLLGWMSMWWVLVCMGIWGVRWMWRESYGYWNEVPKIISLKAGRYPGYGGLVLPFVLMGVVALTYIVWRRRWRRLCITAGLVGDVDPPWKSAVLRWTFIYSTGAVAGMILLGFGVAQVLDRWWPGWDMGP